MPRRSAMRIDLATISVVLFCLLGASRSPLFADGLADGNNSVITFSQTVGIESEPEEKMKTDSEHLEANKAFARRWFEEVINKRNIGAIAEIYSPDYQYHGPEGMEMRGLEPIRKFAASILGASNDRKATVEQQVAEGDLVVTRFISRGHHTGTFQGKEPTGGIWTTEGINIGRIVNDKIVEDWEVIHNSGM
jgi:predicted SnoaL-like aldol condensation-catalyzing enzyme